MDIRRGNGKTTQELAEILDSMVKDATIRGYESGLKDMLFVLSQVWEDKDFYKFLEIIPGDNVFNQYGAEDLMEKWALYRQERDGKEGEAHDGLYI